ncbi:GAF domain-containing protein [Panacagrimonas sp.]|uniref:GAF domain-containing protein n=1 Tax=Panacagrimonas sp. TaxID=2480088 RepID=UPI003B51FBA6
MIPLRPWLRLFLPVATVATLLAAAGARLHYQSALQDRIGRENLRLAVADQDLARRLQDAALDLRVIADAPALAAYLGHSDAEGRRGLERLFGSFVEQKPLFDAFALYAGGADELAVRVRRSGSGTAEREPAASNPTDRVRGFTDTNELAPRSIRLSRFELLQYGNEIVRPLRPVIYLSMRLNFGGGEQVLQARLRGAVLLRSIEQQLSAAPTQTWLLDPDGYWLLHPDARVSWGLQLDSERRLDRRAPHLAEAIGGADGVLRDADALYVYRRLRELPAAAAEAGLELSGSLHAVQRIPWQALPAPWPLLPLGLGALGLLLWAAASAVHVHLRHRAAISERHAQALLDANQRATDDQAWIRERIYRLSLKANAAADLRGFGEAVLSELAPGLKLGAACLYRLQHDRCLLVATYGLQHSEVPREFAIGQGLVGEVARTREARQVAPPPAGYLDLFTGLGGGAGAELHILPLWIQEHALGVLELACAETLDARQRELLDQLRPLLALNLAGRTGGLHSGR